MAKTPSPRLFNLIKSLSSSERRYFKVQHKQDEESKYWKLFCAIEQQEDFDDTALQQLVYQEEVITSRKYSELKSYLYQQILTTLQQFDEQSSIDYRLKNALQQVQSLFRRWLLDDCWHVLRQAKKWATKYERFTVLLELINWEKRLAYASADIDYLDQYLKELEQNEKNCLACIRNLKSYEYLFYELYVLVSKNTLTKDIAQRVEEVSNNVLLQTEETCLSYRAKIFYARCQAFLQYHQRNRQGFNEACRQLVSQLEQKPHLLREDVSIYIGALSNLSVSYGYIGQYDNMLASLEKLRKVKPNTRDDEMKIIRQYYNNYFSYCINTGHFSQGYDALEKHHREVRNLDSRLFQRNFFYYQYFYLSFGAAAFDDSLTYLNQWLNSPRSVEQQDIKNLARLLSLVIHFELGNHLLLASLLRSAQRGLQKLGQLRTFEQQFIQCMRRVNQEPSAQERQNIFKQHWEELEQIQFSPTERAMTRFFNFSAWLEAKATKRTFAKVVQQRLATV